MWKDKKNSTKKETGKKVIEKPKAPVETWGDYYYMTSSTCTVVEIAAALQEKGVGNLEVWPDMGVLEWPTTLERSIDMETLEPFSDAEDVAFLKKHNIASIFSLHISSLDEDTFLRDFAVVLERFAGAVCCDTATFEPVVMGNWSK